jgi:hypothetical protein
MMIKQIPIRGNICSCGEVWFCYDLPESDPDRCPYCKREIDDGEVHESANTERDMAEGNIPESIERGLGKATGKTQVSLVAKACNFCNNELFFDKEDAGRANACCYCKEGILMPVDLLDPGIGDEVFQDPNLVGGVDINELIDQMVAVKFKSLNPWNKPLEYIFKGIDPMTQMVKLQGTGGQILWEHLESIKTMFKV